MRDFTASVETCTMKRGPSRRIGLGCLPFPERLERRDCPSVTIQIDYSYDANNFFDTAAKRAVMQEAADTLGARLADRLAAIAPNGGNTWSEIVPDPATGLLRTIPNPAVPADTVVIFAGGRPLGGARELGVGSTGGTRSTGTATWNDLVGARGQPGALLSTPTDFGPWGGSVSFDTTANWYFGASPSAMTSTQDDFLSVSLHELFHALGFGTAPSWNALATGPDFAGAVSRSVYEGLGAPPLSPDHAHWAAGTTSGGDETLMDPSIVAGTRKLPTRLDYAGLQDVGWSLLTDPGSTLSTAGAPVIASTGSVTLTGLTLGPDPTDVNLVPFLAGPGLVFTATTSLPQTGTSIDTYLRLFDAAGNELKAANTGVYDTLSLTLPAAGTYFLGVSSAANTAYSPSNDLAGRLAGPTGDYDLTLQLAAAVGSVSSDLSAQIAVPGEGVQEQPLTYTISIVNAGPDLASGVQVNQLLPPGVTFVSASASQGTVHEAGGFLVAQIGAVPAGSGVVLQVTLIPEVSGSVALAARVSALEVDPNSKNNVGAATVSVVQPLVVPPPPYTTPPTIVGARITSSGHGSRKTFTIVLGFSKPLDPAFLSGFALSKPGRTKRHGATPRIAIGLGAAVYNAGDSTVLLKISLRKTLPRGLQLRVSGSPPFGIRDQVGNLLDGDRDGSPGGDAVVSL